MSVEADIRTVLLSCSAVTALVGTGAASRIRPDKLEQDDNEMVECVILEVDNEDHLNTLDGLGGRVMANVTVRCHAPTRTRARALAEAVRVNGANPGTGLAGYSGTVNGHVFDAVLEDEQVAYSPAGEGSDRGYYDVFANYLCTWLETT